MTTFASDFGNECLVTDLVHELSSGLEIPFLLSSSSSAGEDYRFGDEGLESERNSYSWLDQDLNDFNPVKNEVESVCDVGDLPTSLVENEVFSMDLKTDSSGNGSGSDCSSSELWMVKNDLDTPPVTPPEERISPNNILFIANDKLKFIPISPDVSRKSKNAFNSSNKTVRIQPKPGVAALDIIADNQQISDQTIVCNVFKDIHPSPTDRGTKGKDLGSTILSRKDLEILQAKRKQERMIRNRESAYLSRKRKKEYVADLEKQIRELMNENNQLRQENYNLKERLMKYEDVECCYGKSKSFFMDSPRKTTALLALLLTVCLNLGSLSNFLETRSQDGGSLFESDNQVPFHIRHTRSLLWSDPQFDDLNSSLANLSKTSCPVNQTESIRLEGELRRWIRGDDDFSVNRNLSKINHYLDASERVAKSQSKSKRRIRNRKLHPDLEVDVFRMKPRFFNFDTFFEAIHRRDDTFYLVSFSADHLLLPALAHNKTSRPKMSLMLPAFLSNATSGVASDQVEMMQIDCEVTNTQLLSVNENDIPSHMRPYSNSTSKQKNLNGEYNRQFSEYLVDEKEEEDAARGNAGDGAVEKAAKSGEDDVADKGPENLDEYDVVGFRGDFRYNKSAKDKMRVDVKDNAVNGDYIFGRRVRSNLDAVQFMDPSSKNMLKTLIVPPSLSQSRYHRKPYAKTLKSAMKFLIP